MIAALARAAALLIPVLSAAVPTAAALPGSTATYRVGPNAPFKSCRDALRAIKSYRGGTILIEPGVHEDACGRAFRKGNLIIRGISDANGKPPTVIVPYNKKGRGQTFLLYVGLPRDPANAEETANLTVENLIITGYRGPGKPPSMHYGIAASHHARIVLRNLEISYGRGDCIETGHPDEKRGFDYRRTPATGWNHRLEIRDVVVHHCGNGSNQKHNVYVAPHELLVDNLTSYDSIGGHALKIVARVSVEVRNSRLETTRSPAPSPAQRISTTLLDIAGCILNGSRIHDNALIHYFRAAKETARGSGTGRALIDFRRRKSIKGCDNPPYGSAAFRNPETWRAAAAGGLRNPDNDRLFRHFVWNNRLIERRKRAGGKAIGIRNQGTFPIEIKAKDAKSLPAPPEWVERSVVFAVNNRFENIANRYVEGGVPQHPAPIVLGSECNCLDAAALDRLSRGR